jgi:hypothetical protein
VRGDQTGLGEAPPALPDVDGRPRDGAIDEFQRELIVKGT